MSAGVRSDGAGVRSDGADVLQVLFCPAQHNSEHHYGPAIRLVWRTAADVPAVAEPPPEPEDAEPELILEARLLDVLVLRGPVAARVRGASAPGAGVRLPGGRAAVWL
ncbi:hypothetical protein [Amycolatopsis saalfeldensis]|uniref:Uncharacterized protein n=1 Tax=Amycolatopsis saalfeldensis TaxID=394193 RepID=A0A1H8QGX5_9PSEU|nr:hypothetical protein [Amycolatopsis saalfeldensis]SEO53286.1 hypothetical protein SAMN04489732_101349 [Amycolatopsis saalfeldensis]